MHSRGNRDDEDTDKDIPDLLDDLYAVFCHTNRTMPMPPNMGRPGYWFCKKTAEQSRFLVKHSIFYNLGVIRYTSEHQEKSFIAHSLSFLPQKIDYGIFGYPRFGLSKRSFRISCS